MTTHAPDWLKDVRIVEIPDEFPSNKDANLHRKTLLTIEKYRIDDFVWCSDDNVFANQVDLHELPRLVNLKPRERFTGENRWQRRMVHTFDFMDEATGTRQDHHFDVHAPQLFHGNRLLAGMRTVDYISDPGLCIYSTWRAVSGDWKDCEQQGLHKETAESVEEARMVFLDKLFLGYNDSAFLEGGLRDRLFSVFPYKSRYER